MNKTQIKLRKAEGYSNVMPDKVGLWLYVCDENSNVADYVAITTCEKGQMVHDESIGVYPLKNFHEGLTDIMWKFVI